MRRKRKYRKARARNPLAVMRRKKGEWKAEGEVRKELEGTLKITLQDTQAIDELCRRLGLSKVIILGERWDRTNFKWNRGFSVLEEIGHFEFNRVQSVVHAGKAVERVEQPK